MENTQTASGLLAEPNATQEGSLGNEVVNAQRMLDLVHDTIDELVANLRPVIHQIPDMAESALKAEATAQQPIRTDLANEAHLVVTSAASAEARLRSLINHLGL